MRKSRQTLPKLTDRYSLGNTGLKVSPFCMGMVRSEDAIVEAFKAGINFFFFTADMHWPFYEGTRRGIEKILARSKDARKEIVIAVVSYMTQPEFCRMPFEEALDAVPGLKTLDLVVAGGVYSHEFLIRLPVYQDLRSKTTYGAKGIGATFHDRVAARLAINHSLVDIAYLRYNASHVGARSDVFPYLNSHTKTLVYNFKSTLGRVSLERCSQLGIPSDAWVPEVTDYYRFVLTRPEIDGLLCSPGTPKEVKAFAKALELGPLDEEEENFMMDLSKLDAANIRFDGSKIGTRN